MCIRDSPATSRLPSSLWDRRPLGAPGRPGPLTSAAIGRAAPEGCKQMVNSACSAWSAHAAL
eukprot:7113138-Alexandrium_andersonii.AAC.1